MYGLACLIDDHKNYCKGDSTLGCLLLVWLQLTVSPLAQSLTMSQPACLMLALHTSEALGTCCSTLIKQLLWRYPHIYPGKQAPGGFSGQSGATPKEKIQSTWGVIIYIVEKKLLTVQPSMSGEAIADSRRSSKDTNYRTVRVERTGV